MVSRVSRYRSLSGGAGFVVSDPLDLDPPLVACGMTADCAGRHPGARPGSAAVWWETPPPIRSWTSASTVLDSVKVMGDATDRGIMIRRDRSVFQSVGGSAS